MVSTKRRTAATHVPQYRKGFMGVDEFLRHDRPADDHPAVREAPASDSPTVSRSVKQSPARGPSRSGSSKPLQVVVRPITKTVDQAKRTVKKGSRKKILGLSVAVLLVYLIGSHSSAAAPKKKVKAKKK